MKRYKIGFSLLRDNIGPSNFLNNLKNSFRQDGIPVSYFFDPFVDCNVYANIVRNPWNKSYFFRVDGVGFDSSKPTEEIERTNQLLRDGIMNATGVIYQSEFSKKLAETILELQPLSSTTIINGTNTKVFSSQGKNYRKELNISEDAIVFVTSAKWRPRKRLNDMIEVFKRFKESYISNESYFIVIGKEQKNMHDGVIFIPEISNEELPNYLRTANIYLFFGWLDPCPNSVIEAIACGLPVICTDVGGTKEIINLTKGGIVVDADTDFNYSWVDLDNPPKPDYEALLSSVRHMVDNLETFKSAIDTSKIDISYVSKRYAEFIRYELDQLRK